MGAVRHRVGTAGQIPLEHPPDGIGAVAGQLGDLDHRTVLGA
jgi:hypothetical protein